MVTILYGISIANDLNSGTRIMIIDEVRMEGYKITGTDSVEFVFYTNNIKKHVGHMESSFKKITYSIKTLPMTQRIGLIAQPQIVLLHCTGDLWQDCEIVIWGNQPNLISLISLR